MNISVVIPTVGDRNVEPTIKALNQSTIIPEEIIIVTLKRNNFENLSSSYKNIKIIKAKRAGQVNQRIEGFKKAKNTFVMQLDDDIILDRKCIESLYHKIKKNKKASFSPNIFELDTNKSIFNYKIGIKHIIFNIISGINIFNKKGKITLSGFESYPHISNQKLEIIKSEWLIGGCVIHNKNNLITESFFNFKGKAYSEDLFHSIELRKKNIDLFVVKAAKAYLTLNQKEKKFKDFFSELKKDMVIRKSLVRNNNLSLIRMYFIYILKCFNFFISKK